MLSAGQRDAVTPIIKVWIVKQLGVSTNVYSIEKHKNSPAKIVS